MSTHERSDAAKPAVGEAAGIWLDGDVLACACPDCGAPMSIRLWLLVADCWRCGASLELTEEQERAAQRLLEVRQVTAKQPAPAPKPAALPVVQRPLPQPAPTPLPATIVKPARQAAAAPHQKVQQQISRGVERGPLYRTWDAMQRDLPAWLASLVVHLVLLIVLAFWIVRNEDFGNQPLGIVLSTQTRDRREEGGKVAPPMPDPVEFEAPGVDEVLKEVQLDEIKPDPQAVVERPEEPNPADGEGELGKGKRPEFANFGQPARQATGELVAGRAATARYELVEKEGGTSLTEAAVTRGLEWLERHQNADGSWSLDRFHKAGECKGRCGSRGYIDSDIAATGLALLPYLGAGQTHREGQYQAEVERGLRWLINQQRPSGDFPSPFANSHMYAHAIASIALCEAYAMTRSDWLRDPAQLAVDFIVASQHRDGGWRYQPREAGDTSVLGWQLMALKSAQMANLRVPATTFEMAGVYLDDAQVDEAGGRYGYMPGRGATHVMTAEALLCRQYLGWPQQHPGMESGVRHLLRSHLPAKRDVNMYYWYYATQVMHHVGGDAWDSWNFRMRDLLVDLQETKGHAAGSWSPRGNHDDSGGRLYMTALAVCTLEVYYRHLPLYRQVATEFRKSE